MISCKCYLLCFQIALSVAEIKIIPIDDNQANQKESLQQSKHDFLNSVSGQTSTEHLNQLNDTLNKPNRLPEIDTLKIPQLSTPRDAW